MEVRVLGALAVREGQVSVDLGGRQQRLVLAALVANSGDTVRLDVIVETLWPAEPPASARKAIQGYVSNLRKLLGPPTIETTASGYRLNPELVDIDADRFGALVARSDESAPEKEASLREALDLWSGEPYEDLADCDTLQPEIARLNERRLAAAELLADSLLAGNEASEALQLARDVIERSPFREQPYELEIRSLYQLGRQQEALRAYERARRLLATELGIEPGTALRALERQVLVQDPSLDAPQEVRQSRNPYRGLRPFDEGSADEFFGRDALIRRLHEQIDRSGEHGLTLLTGASGVGKSSVVRAGLLPALRREGRTVAIFDHPNASGFLDDATSGTWDAEVVFVDQLESGLGNAESAVRTLGRLADLVLQPDGPAVVVTLRADHLDTLIDHPRLGGLVDSSIVVVPALTDDELAAAIKGPASRAGVGVSDELTQRLIADMRRRTAALPLLQYALTETFERCDGTTLEIDDYRSAGGLGGALRRRAEMLFDPLSDDQKVAVRHALMRLVSVGHDGRPTLQPKPLGDFTGLQREVLEAFGAHRMVTFDRTSATPSVAISHEVLVRDWPRLTQWIDQAEDDLRLASRLSDAATHWNSEGRSPELLFSASRTALYDGELALQLGRVDEEFLGASRIGAAQAKRRRRVLLSMIAAALIAATAVSVLFSLDARRERETAEQQRSRAESQALSSTALLEARSDPELGVLLALQADSTSESVRPLLEGLGRLPGEPVTTVAGVRQQGNLGFGLLGEGPWIAGELLTLNLCVSETGPGRFVAAGAVSIVTFDVAAGTDQVSIDVDRPICDLSLHDDGRRALASSPYGGTVLIDLETGETLARSPDFHRGQWIGDRILGFSNSQYAAYGQEWNEQSVPVPLVWSDTSLGTENDAGLSGTLVVPSPSGDRLLVTDAVMIGQLSSTNDVHRTVIDSDDFSVIADLGVMERTLWRPVWSPDGTRIADVSHGGNLRVWDANSGTKLADSSVADLKESVWPVWSPSGTKIAIVGRDGRVDLRSSSATGEVVVLRRNGREEEQIVGGSFVDEVSLAVYFGDGAVEIFDTRASALTPFTPAPDRPSVLGAVGSASTIDLELTSDLALVRPSQGDLIESGLQGPPDAGGLVGLPDSEWRAWAARGTSDNGFRWFESVRVDIGSGRPVGGVTKVGLDAGTTLVVPHSSGVLIQSAAGTVRQMSYDGTLHGGRIDLRFKAEHGAVSPSGDYAVLIGDGQMAVLDLRIDDAAGARSGVIVSTAEVALVGPIAMPSDEYFVVGRPSGEIELWAVEGLVGLGSLVRPDIRVPGDFLSVSNGGQLWYHNDTGSAPLKYVPAELRELACRQTTRPLFPEEVARFLGETEEIAQRC